MKKTFTLVLLLCVAIGTFAAPRTVDQARREASSFLLSGSSSGAKRLAANTSLSLAHVVSQKTNTAPAAYVFQSGVDNGFVIVSADDACTSVLGYSDSGTFDADHIPANLQTWLQHYAEEIEWAARQPQTPLSRRPMADLAEASGRSVLPLLHGIQWGQEQPFNNACPIDSDNERSVTGCVATAASQIMAFWQHPVQGTGTHSYTWKRSNGTTRMLSVNFGNTTYDWSHMLSSYTGSYTSTQANAVATLMYHTGVACDMSYSSVGSGASSAAMINAMHTYFGYDAATMCYNADYEGFDVLAEKIQEELEAGRPVMMSGATVRNEGHCFVCEGSDGTGRFYFNWGWDGSCDGYYQLTALQPTAQGVGGASSGLAFTVRVAAFTGIQPEQGGVPSSPKLGCKSVSMGSASVLPKTGQLIFSLDELTNIGLSTWTGNVAMAIYDADHNYVGKIQKSSSYSLLPAHYSDETLTISGTLPQLPDGRYVIVPAYTITGVNGVTPMLIKSTVKQFPFTLSGNVIDFRESSDVDQEAQYTIVFKDSDTGSDSGTQISSGALLSSIIAQSDITISSCTYSYIYLAKDNFGLKFGSSSKDGFLTINLGQEIIVDSINIEIGGYNDTERSFILQETTLTNLRKASTGFETRTVKLNGARLSTISLKSSKRAYVKSLTIYTTDRETKQANFDFSGGIARDYTSLGDGTCVTVYLTTEDYVGDNSTSVALAGTCLALDLGTASPSSIVGTYVLGADSTYTPGLFCKNYSYLSYEGEWYEIEGGVLSIINNSRNQFEFLYDIQVADGKSYTGNVTLPVSSVPLYSGYSKKTWQYEPIVAWDVDTAYAEIAKLPLNAPTIHTYLVEGIITRIDGISGNVAQFYVSQDGTTNQQLYCYNARYLNNVPFVGGEIAVGDTVVMFAKLENYNGTYELMGYVFQHRPYIDFKPYNLVVEQSLGIFEFSWDCDAKPNWYELAMTRVSDDSTHTTYTNDKFYIFRYAGGVEEFSWRVRSVDALLNPLSDWADGENFFSLSCPYQPFNLQATTVDGHNYLFSWSADSIAASYTVVITYVGETDSYAQLIVNEPMAAMDFAISGNYSWEVYAFDADENQVGYNVGYSFEVNDSTDYSIKNLSAITNGLTISAIWESPAPIFDVRVLNANEDQIYSQICYSNSMQYTVPATGTYYVFVRPVNAEFTYYLDAWEYTTVIVSSSTPSTASYQLTLRAMTGGTIVTGTSGTYAYGSVVDIEAAPNPGYRFLQWSDGNTNVHRSVVMTQDLSLTAYFYEIETATLTLNSAVGGHVSLAAGEHIYALNAMEILFAIADPDYEFAYWLIAGQTVPTVTNPLLVTLSADVTVTPVFVLKNVETAVEEVPDSIRPKTIKCIIDNQVVIVSGEHAYNMLGQKIR